jgi:hypothetical protein
MAMSRFYGCSATQGLLLLAVIGALGRGSSTRLPPEQTSVPAPAAVPDVGPPDGSDAAASVLPDRPVPGELAGPQALRYKLELLQRGRAFLESVPGYTAELTKQEVVADQLLAEQRLFLKCRHRPFSVYLYWFNWDPGREVLYIEGHNKGRLIGHDGGWKARIPALSLAPDSAFAMRDSRYPVTKAGFLSLIDLMCQAHEEDLQEGTSLTCQYEFPVSFDGRDCHAFTTVYASREASPTYRKSITLIDAEWRIPLRTEHFGWPETAASVADANLDEETLLEAYQFTDVNFDCSLSDADFDRNNSEYAFR